MPIQANFETNEDQVAQIDLSGGDFPEGSIIESATEPKYGYLDSTEPQLLTYFPDPNFWGVDEFSFTTINPDNIQTTAYSTVVVNPVNDAPTVYPYFIQFFPDSGPIEISFTELLWNAIDPEGDPVEVVSSFEGETEQGANVSFNPDTQTITYTAPENLTESLLDSFEYTVSDGTDTSSGDVNLQFFTQDEYESLFPEIEFEVEAEGDDGVVGELTIGVAEDGSIFVQPPLPPSSESPLSSETETPPSSESSSPLQTETPSFSGSFSSSETETPTSSPEYVRAEYTVSADVFDREELAVLKLAGYTFNVNDEETERSVFSGEDFLQGDDGDNLILGDERNDVLQGGKGSDVIRGSEGDDIINGGQNADIIFGGAGNDIISGDLGRDLIVTGDGEDLVVLKQGFDVVADFDTEFDTLSFFDGSNSISWSQTEFGILGSYENGQVHLIGVEDSSLVAFA